MPDGIVAAKTLSGSETWGIMALNGQRCMAGFRMARRPDYVARRVMPRSVEDTGEIYMLARRAFVALFAAGALAACAGETPMTTPGTAAGPGSAPLQQATDSIAGRNSQNVSQGMPSMSNRQATGEAVSYTGQGSGSAGRGVTTQTPGASPTFGGRGN